MKNLGTLRIETDYNLMRDDSAGIAYRYKALCTTTGNIAYTSDTIEHLKSLILGGYPERSVTFGSPVLVAREIEGAK